MQTSKDLLLHAFAGSQTLLKKISEDAKVRKIPVIDRQAGSLVEAISLIFQPKDILEIGCGIGFSTYFLLKNIKKARYTGIDLNRTRLMEAREWIGSFFKNIQTEFIAGNALTILPEMKKRFDLVLIDAAKHEYPQYFEAVVSKTKKEAVIIADNVLYQKKMLGKKIQKRDENSVRGIKRYLELLASDQRFDTAIFDIGDGLAVSLKKD